MNDAALHPPRPRLVLRIGVTGHRPGDSLPSEAVDRVRGLVRGILACAAKAASDVHQKHRGVYSAEAPLLVAVSAVAEGGDRIFAEEALAAGCKLDVVLPRRRDDYETDFQTEDSRSGFHALLGRARAVLEIDDKRTEKDTSAGYETAGLVMLDHADLVIAIWDGGESRGRGGTREILDEALRRTIPVVWIYTLEEKTDASASGQPAASWDGKTAALWDGKTAAPLLHLEDRNCAPNTALAEIVASVLAPPSGSGKGMNPMRRLENYLREVERQPPFWSGGYLFLLCVVSGKRPIRLLPRLTPIADRKNEWKGFIDRLPPCGPGLTEALGNTLLSRYLWADHIATELSHVYRGAYVLNFFFAAFAVASGLGAVFFWQLNAPTHFAGPFSDALTAKTTFAAIEFVLIGLTVWMALRGEQAAWHQRFLDFRRLAEMLRHARVLAPVGRAAQATIEKGAADAGDLWTAWYAQATLRELPLPDANADAAFLRAVAKVTIEEEISGQIGYHERNAAQLDHMHHRLDKIGQIFFLVTGLLCVLWFGLVAIFGYELLGHHGRTAWIKPALTYFGAVLPALAAAVAGIRAQGDFLAFAKRSHATEKELRQLKSRLENPPETGSYRGACALLRAVADTMASDLGLWRLVYRNHPLTIG